MLFQARAISRSLSGLHRSAPPPARRSTRLPPPPDALLRRPPVPAPLGRRRGRPRRRGGGEGGGDGGDGVGGKGRVGERGAQRRRVGRAGAGAGSAARQFGAERGAKPALLEQGGGFGVAERGGERAQVPERGAARRARPLGGPLARAGAGAGGEGGAEAAARSRKRSLRTTLRFRWPGTLPGAVGAGAASEPGCLATLAALPRRRAVFFTWGGEWGSARRRWRRPGGPARPGAGAMLQHIPSRGRLGGGAEWQPLECGAGGAGELTPAAQRPRGPCASPARPARL